MAIFTLSRSLFLLLLALLSLFSKISISEATSLSFSFKSSDKNASFESYDIALHGDAKLVDGGSSIQLNDFRVGFEVRVSGMGILPTPMSTYLPVEHAGSGNYVVRIGFGTPMHNLSLAFDTGSDLTWIQCEPCTGSCYRQKEPIFNPSSSSSFSNIACSSPECDSLQSAGQASGCFSSNCGYNVTYNDGSSTKGFLAKERLTLTNSDVFDGFKFGCSEDNRGTFNGIAGVLGLASDEISFLSQTATTYNNTFSYCLPSSSRFTGYLTFGSAGISRSVKYTPISKFWEGILNYNCLDVQGILVGGKQLDISLTVFSNICAIIDSGTVISRLPPKAYRALRTAFKENMSIYKATSSRDSLLDTCYDLTGVEKVRVPKISFAFNGDTVIDVDPVGILYELDESCVCLAFAANTDGGNATIFGNFQQRKMQVVYDGPGKRVGFAPNACN